MRSNRGVIGNKLTRNIVSYTNRSDFIFIMTWTQPNHEVTSETGHTTDMPKTGQAIRYFLGREWVGYAIFSGY